MWGWVISFAAIRWLFATRNGMIVILSDSTLTHTYNNRYHICNPKSDYINRSSNREYRHKFVKHSAAFCMIHYGYVLHPTSGVYDQNGDKSKRRQVKTATPKRRQKWLYSKRRQTPNNTYSSSDAYNRPYAIQYIGYRACDCWVIWKSIRLTLARNRSEPVIFY